MKTIYKLTFDHGRIDWCTAKDIVHLLKSYDSEFDLLIQELLSIDEIPEDEAKTIMVTNFEYDECDPDDSELISIYDLAISNEFSLIATNEPN
jgi:hypothetical protein